MLMAEVVELAGYKLAKAASRGSPLMEKAFRLRLTHHLKPSHLPDRVLAGMIGLDQASQVFLQDLVTRILGLGQSHAALDKEDQLVVLDAHLLLADQLRFEALLRLGWLSSYPGQELGLVRTVLEPESILRSETPLEMPINHPDFAEFNLRRDTDGQVVVRRLIPQGAKLFIQRHGSGPPDNDSLA
jgi:hypothetical protein